MRYQGIIFDLDGTLGDTLPLCIAAFRESIEPLAGRVVSDEEIIATFGPSEEGTVMALVPDRYEEGVVAFLERYEALHDICPSPFDGIRDLLALLEARGVRMGLVTGKGRRSADITLERFGLHFDDIEAGWQHGPRKVEGIRDMVERFGLDPSRVLYVGDTASDVRSARDAGVKVVSAAWASTTNLEALREAKPDALFESVREFEEWLFPEDVLIRFAQRIQALAQTGLTYTKDRYDIDRYEELREISASLMSFGGAHGEHVRLEAFQDQLGYATPKVDVRAVVLREGRILMAREAADGLWSLPGGWADVGDRPSVAVEREVFEESGLVVKATRFLGVWDRNLHGHTPEEFQVYKLFFLCEEVSGELTTSEDSLELGFFDPSDLPPLSLPRIVPEQIRWCVGAAADPNTPAYFD